ncbi:MAG TPA: MBL fold metallo-hydrolase [Herpetosiphonaceae bacterium]|nr:MBL fold metallo-hydrolase [Herpetosiphonaceae bacterium]
MAQVPTIDVQTLAAWLTGKHPLMMLDVRPLGQRMEWSIHGSVHVDAHDSLWSNRPEVLDVVALPHDLPIVAICAAGKTSLLAAAYLQGRGYDALSLEGGMQAWSLAWNTADVPVEGTSARITQVRRLGKGCLSYLIQQNDRLAVIDPSLPVAAYQRLAAERGAAITDVLETHIHADHLSRARALAEATRASLWLPAQRRTGFSANALFDGDEVAFGPSTIRALATPGHTAESVCYLLDERVLFSGDTVSLDGIGRPDLAQNPAGAEAQSGQLYHSLQRLWALPGAYWVLPAHTGESLHLHDGPIAAPLEALQDRFHDVRLSQAAFVERVLSRLPATPANYRTIIRLNELGRWQEDRDRALEVGANRCTIGA